MTKLVLSKVLIQNICIGITIQLIKRWKTWRGGGLEMSCWHAHCSHDHEVIVVDFIPEKLSILSLDLVKGSYTTDTDGSLDGSYRIRLLQWPQSYRRLEEINSTTQNGGTLLKYYSRLNRYSQLKRKQNKYDESNTALLPVTYAHKPDFPTQGQANAI